ncbi:MAG: DUF1492 domain-containing protein [Oscillospiraceae bacterium]|nr:DUF1492 domain-containing protein [Oscillospiraceae bacterium]
MTAGEYLKQAYRLDQKINSSVAQAEQLRKAAASVSLRNPGGRVLKSPSGEAPFVSRIERVMELEESIDRETDRLVDLRRQIRQVISGLNDPDEQLVLEYRYIHGFTWEQIGDTLNAASRTVRRWHRNALEHVILPEDAIRI